MGFFIIKRAAFGMRYNFDDDKDLKEMMNVFTRVDASKSWSGGFFAGTYDFLPVTKYLSIIAFLSSIGNFIKLNKQMHVSWRLK